MKGNRLVFVSMVIILLELILELIFVSSILNEGDLTRIIVINLIGLLIFFSFYKNNKMMKKQYFRFLYLFLFGFLIVHFQMYLEIILGTYRTFYHDYLIDPTIVNKSAIISSMALFSILIGFTYKNRISVTKKNTIYVSKGGEKVFFILNLVLFVIFLFTANKDYLSGGYGKTEIGVIANYVQIYLISSFLGIIAYTTYQVKRREFRKYNLIQFIKLFGLHNISLMIMYMGIVIITGDRGPVLQILISLFTSYILVTRKKIKLIFILGMLMFGAFLITSLGFIREVSLTDDFTQKINEVGSMSNNSSENQTISPYTIELARSIRPMHGAVSYVDNNALFFGKYQITQVIGIIPGVGTIFKKIFDLDKLDTSSAEFLTNYIENGNVTHGLGTTCVADVYLDFGIFGVIILFILFGYFIQNLEYTMFTLANPKLYQIVLGIVFMSRSIYIGRSSIITVFREVFMIYVLIIIVRNITRYLTINGK